MQKPSSPKLSPTNFDPEMVSMMRSVLDAAVGKIELVNRTPATKAKMAERILRAASDGVTDKEILTAIAMEDGKQPADQMPTRHPLRPFVEPNSVLEPEIQLDIAAIQRGLATAENVTVPGNEAVPIIRVRSGRDECHYDATASGFIEAFADPMGGATTIWRVHKHLPAHGT